MESNYSWNPQRWTEINTTEPCFFRNSPKIEGEEALSPESKLSQVNRKGKRDDRKAGKLTLMGIRQLKIVSWGHR